MNVEKLKEMAVKVNELQIAIKDIDINTDDIKILAEDFMSQIEEIDDLGLSKKLTSEIIDFYELLVDDFFNDDFESVAYTVATPNIEEKIQVKQKNKEKKKKKKKELQVKDSNTSISLKEAIVQAFGENADTVFTYKGLLKLTMQIRSNKASSTYAYIIRIILDVMQEMGCLVYDEINESYQFRLKKEK